MPRLGPKLSADPNKFDGMPADLSLLDADGVLSAAEDNERSLRLAEAHRLEIAAAWADLHGVVDDPERSAALPGAERLVRLGGDGTPEVAEFAPAELGAVLGVSPGAAAALVANALDLRHRLPALWARVRAGEARAWVARRVADLTRAATREAAAAVDRRVAPFAHSLPPARLENVAQAAMIAADPAAAERAAHVASDSQGVWVSDDSHNGMKDVLVRADAASAADFDAAVDRVADGLGRLGDADPKQVRRGKAVGVLASPQAALDLYEQAFGAPATGPGGATPRRADPRPKAVLFVHVTDHVLRSGSGVARVDGVGPVVAKLVRDWLGRRAVIVRPVLDLAGVAPVDGYEAPDEMREAVRLHTPADVFPHATCTSRRMDLDHTDPYVDPGDGGPPGQTRPGNLGPHTRRTHRIKTHSRWRVRQIADGAYLWRSPHGRHYLVDQTGTTAVTPLAAEC
jgi:hypothetical protein